MGAELLIYCFLITDCDLEYYCPKTECVVLQESELSREILAYYQELQEESNGEKQLPATKPSSP